MQAAEVMGNCRIRSRERVLMRAAGWYAGRELEGFIPKSAKDFEEYAALVVQKYLLPQVCS